MNGLFTFSNFYKGNPLKRILNEKFSLILVGIGITFIIIALFLFFFNVDAFDTSLPIDGELFGQFGDIVGGVVGSLWALAGVILFYVGLTEQRKALGLNETALSKQIDALNIQQNEMQLLRDEYRMAREVFEQQKEAIREQVKTNSIQQFESNFYSLLDIYTHITDEIFKDGGDLQKINKEIRDEYEHRCSECIKERYQKSSELYIKIFDKKGDKISHYLKTVYRIFKVIEERADLTDKQKYFYAKIMRSQFTSEELFIIYYNATSSYGANFRTLILKYNLLKHLSFFSKLETERYALSSPIHSYNRGVFCEHLANGLGDFFEYADDYAYEEMRHNILINIDEEIISIDFMIDDEQVIVIDFFINDEVYKNFDFYKSNFKEMLTDFIVDIFFHSNFLTFESDDELNISEIKENQIRLQLKTDKNIKVKKDLY